MRGLGGAGALPAHIFDKCLVGMGVPTSSKWEVLPLCCDKFLQTLALCDGLRGFGVTMYAHGGSNPHVDLT